MENVKNDFYGLVGGSILLRYLTETAYVFPENTGKFTNRVIDRFVNRNKWVLSEGYELNYDLGMSGYTTDRYAKELEHSGFTIVQVETGTEVCEGVLCA